MAYAASVATDNATERIEFDVFVSMRGRTRCDFVRPLAHALEARRLRPWYDEFTLRPGDSLRRSIDHGLLTSQAGIVVLSPAFFAKRHMIGDHQGRTAGTATPLARALDELLGTYTSGGAAGACRINAS